MNRFLFGNFQVYIYLIGPLHPPLLLPSFNYSVILSFIQKNSHVSFTPTNSHVTITTIVLALVLFPSYKGVKSNCGDCGYSFNEPRSLDIHKKCKHEGF